MKSKKISWINAPDIKKRTVFLVKKLSISWVKTQDIIFFRSKNSKTRAIARIWGLSRVWQLALSEKPKYILEVVAERFDKLPEKKKDEVLLHELSHIPKNFSGAMVPHTRHRKGSFHDKLRKLISRYYENNTTPWR